MLNRPFMKTLVIHLLSKNIYDIIRAISSDFVVRFARVPRRSNVNRPGESSDEPACPGNQPEDEQKKDAFTAAGGDENYWQQGIEKLEEDLFMPLSYYLEGYKTHEIAEYLQQTPAAIEQKIKQAKLVLTNRKNAGEPSQEGENV